MKDCGWLNIEVEKESRKWECENGESGWLKCRRCVRLARLVRWGKVGKIPKTEITRPSLAVMLAERSLICCLTYATNASVVTFQPVKI